LLKVNSVLWASRGEDDIMCGDFLWFNYIEEEQRVKEIKNQGSAFFYK
jgi:hypothetical protein